MDDFEYSVHISEQDWDSFFQECEECNLLPPVLAGTEDSGMSDMDEIASRRARMDAESRVPEPELQTNSPDRVESPVDLYLSRYGMSSPVQVLSGSEDDLHMEAVNVFFERLKSLSANEDTSKRQKHCSGMGSKMVGHLEGAVPVETRPNRRRESMQKNDSCTCRFNKPTPTEFKAVTQVSTYPDTELVIKEEKSSWDTIKEVMKWDDKESRLQSGIGKIPCCTPVNGKNPIGPISEKKVNSQLLIISDSDSKELLVSQGQTSTTPRRKRRKKKRTSTEPVEADHGHEILSQDKQSESDDYIFSRRKEMDRETCPPKDGSTGTLSETASALHILPPPLKIDSILENLIVHPQSFPGNVEKHILVYPNAPKTCQGSLDPPSTITAVQNKRTPDFMYEKRDLTGKPASAGQSARTETGVPVKERGLIMLHSGDSTSTPTNGDNAGSNLQLNSNLSSENKTALQAPKALSASITTCDEVEVALQSTEKPGNTENTLLLSSGDMKKDFSVSHDMSNLQVNSTTLAPTALLLSGREVCSPPPYSPHVQSQEKSRETVMLPDFQCERPVAICQRKTSASADISFVTFPEITQELPGFCNNAEKKQNLTCVTHKEVPTTCRNGHDILGKESLSGTIDSKLGTQSDPVNIRKAQVSLQNAQTEVHNTQMQATQCPSADTKPEVKNEVTEVAVIPNKFENRKHPLHQQHEDWAEDISSTLDHTLRLPESKQCIHFKEIKTLSPASEDRNEGLSLEEKSRMCQPLIQFNGLESQLKENSALLNSTTAGNEENFKVCQVATHYGSLKDHELSPNTIMQNMASPISGSVDGARGLEPGNGKLYLHSQNKDWTEEAYPSLRSRDITDSPGNENGIKMKRVEILSPSAQDKNEVLSIKEQTKKCQPLTQITGQKSQLDENSKSEYISSHHICTSSNENVPAHCPLTDHEMSLGAITQDMTSPIAQSMDGAEHTPYNISTTCDEENGKVTYMKPQFPHKYHVCSPSAVMQSVAPPASQSMDGAEHNSSNIINTGDEEKVKVHHIQSQFPPKDFEYSLSAVMQSVASPTPQSVEGAGNPSSTIITAGDEEKGEEHHIPPPFPPKDLKSSPGASPMASPTTQSVDGGEHTSYTVIISSDEEKVKAHNIPPQLPPEDFECSPSAVMQSMAPPTPQSVDGAKHISSTIITSGDEEKGKVHYIPPPFPPKDFEYSSGAVMESMTSPSPQSMDGAEHISSTIITRGDKDTFQFPPKDNELSANKLTEDMASHTPESMDGAKSSETSDAVSKPSHPVYAISSFWNEMEKLTINDILRLRLVGQAQHPGVLLQSEDSGIADISDAADSGYFTHLDDSKPDRSSGDMSFISDFDEELAQLHTEEAAKLDEESRESPNSGGVMWESDLDPSGTGTGLEDVFMLSSETALSPPLYRDNAQQCFRKMCKNISVQNLQDLEAQPFRKILRNASLLSIHSVHSTHSLHTEAEDDYVDPFDRVDASSPVCLSDDEEDIESNGITFSEIIQYLFGGDEPERCASAADNIAASYLDGTGTSLPETYDHFFSEFEDGSLFYPLAEDTSSSKDELVPIFSCSRSANRNLQFPEVYDYFFSDDSSDHSDEDEEHTVIPVVTRHDYMRAKSHHAVTTSDAHEELYPETGWNFLRNNPLSFRRIRRTGFTAPPERSSSLALTPVRNSSRTNFRGIQPINAMGADEKPFVDPLLLNLENRIFRQLADQQNIRKEIQTAVADPRVDAALMPLRQADMCLVCIAFASWVLKSANPQGADMWKAALLANISALSAIRYLRRYMRDEATRKTPLRQIEPA